jgi:hypothetical protein
MMGRRRLVLTLAAAVTAAAAFSGCGGGGDDSGSGGAAGPITSKGVEYAYQMPSTVPGGLSTINYVNAGSQYHEWALAKIKPATRSPTSRLTSTRLVRTRSRHRGSTTWAGSE